MATRLLMAVTAPQTALAFLQGQLSWLREHDYDVTVVASPGPELDLVADREGVRVCPLPMRREIALAADLRAFIGFLRLIRQERPDVVHVSTPKAGFVGGLAAWAVRVPGRVYTLRGLRLETVHGFRRGVLWATEWLACWSAHRIVVVSPSLAERVVRLRLTKWNKLVIIGRGSSNGVDSERFAPTPEHALAGRELRSRLGIADDAPVIGFVGRLTRDKGIVQLLEAFAQVELELPAARLLIVGEIEAAGDLPVTLRRRLGDRTSILRLACTSDTAAAYQAIDVLALPTHREGFPNVALEAAAAGRPVVTTTATGAVDSVLDGRTGILVPPFDADALAAALLRLLLNPVEAAQMGQTGRDWVKTEFRPDTIWRGLSDVYSSVLPASRRPGPQPSI